MSRRSARSSFIVRACSILFSPIQWLLGRSRRPTEVVPVKVSRSRRSAPTPHPLCPEPDAQVTDEAASVPDEKVESPQPTPKPLDLTAERARKVFLVWGIEPWKGKKSSRTSLPKERKKRPRPVKVASAGRAAGNKGRHGTKRHLRRSH